jgi:hypothetical protein
MLRVSPYDYAVPFEHEVGGGDAFASALTLGDVILSTHTLQLAPGRRGSGYALGAVGIDIDPPPGDEMRLLTRPNCQMNYTMFARNAEAHVRGEIGLIIVKIDGLNRPTIIRNWWQTLWNRSLRQTRGIVRFSQNNPVELRDRWPLEIGYRYQAYVQSRVLAVGRGFRRRQGRAVGASTTSTLRTDVTWFDLTVL